MVKRKLYRSRTDYILTGVAGGLGEYFEIDPTIVRLGFILLSLGGGSGILVYLIMSIIVSREPGKEVALDRTDKVKEMIEDIGDKAKELMVDDDKPKLKNKPDRKRLLGIVLLMVGGLALWNRVMPYYINSEILWPVAVMLVGLFILLK